MPPPAAPAATEFRRPRPGEEAPEVSPMYRRDASRCSRRVAEPPPSGAKNLETKETSLQYSHSHDPGARLSHGKVHSESSGVCRVLPASRGGKEVSEERPLVSGRQRPSSSCGAS